MTDESQALEVRAEPVNELAAEVLKDQIDSFLAVREHLRNRIAEIMVPKVDYYIIKDRKSLAKPGAEKLAAIMQYRSSFQVDRDSQEFLDHNKEAGLICFVCTILNRHGEPIAEGRGADWLERCQNDPNKTIKMAQKRAYIDAVIRATGLSDLFTQDIEDMPDSQAEAAGKPVREPPKWNPPPSPTLPPPPAGGRAKPVRQTPSATASAPAPQPAQTSKFPVLPGGAALKRQDPETQGKIMAAIATEILDTMSDKHITDADRDAVTRGMKKYQDSVEGLTKVLNYLKKVLYERGCGCDLPFGNDQEEQKQ